jgi:hypothetical protein
MAMASMMTKPTTMSHSAESRPSHHEPSICSAAPRARVRASSVRGFFASVMLSSAAPRNCVRHSSVVERISPSALAMPWSICASASSTSPCCCAASPPRVCSACAARAWSVWSTAARAAASVEAALDCAAAVIEPAREPNEEAAASSSVRASAPPSAMRPRPVEPVSETSARPDPMTSAMPGT